MSVAKEILAQLGNGRFVAMTGAKNLLAGKDSLSFRLPRANRGINAVRVTLTADDLYNVEFGKVRGTSYSVIDLRSGVYNDQLRAVFEDTTGLRTSL